jgi:hypothetical protein
MGTNLNIIPDWDFDGVLPASNAGAPTSWVRSPYIVSVYDLVMRFGDTQPRRRLLRGLLDFRVELHNAGLNRGFQWIDGSFAENVEEIRGRPPNDIDLVTFIYVPNGHSAESFVNSFPRLFDRDDLKVAYAIDAYFVQLDQTTPEDIVNQSTYWYSFWSHTRAGRWKGYLQIDLDSGEDESAGRQLDLLQEEGGQA